MEATDMPVLTEAVEAVAATDRQIEEETLLAELRERNPHGSAADMAFSREEIRRVLQSRSSSDAPNTVDAIMPRRFFVDFDESEQRACHILNHAMEYLMNRVPMGGPDTVFADIQHTDMQAAAILARASRELFIPTTQPFLAPAPAPTTLRDRLRMMAAHLGLAPQRRTA
jgi:hypothetical protein